MLDITTEQALIVSRLVNEALTSIDDEIFLTDCGQDLMSESDELILEALEEELYQLENLQENLDWYILEDEKEYV